MKFIAGTIFGCLLGAVFVVKAQPYITKPSFIKINEGSIVFCGNEPFTISALAEYEPVLKIECKADTQPIFSMKYPQNAAVPVAEFAGIYASNGTQFMTYEEIK